MENQKNQDSSYITTFTNCTVSNASTFIISNNSINYTVDSNDWIFVDDGSSTDVIYTNPYQELEEAKQQEEELRKENSCLQDAWDEYQLILKLLEDNECDKYVEKRYGMKK